MDAQLEIVLPFLYHSLLHLVLIFLSQNIVNPTAGSGSGHGAANSAEDPSQPHTNIRDLLQVLINHLSILLFSSILAFCQGLLVDELRNWIQRHAITSTKSRKKDGKYLCSHV